MSRVERDLRGIQEILERGVYVKAKAKATAKVGLGLRHKGGI